MTTTVENAVTAPGVYELPEDVYHADPTPNGSLSVSGAKKLLAPSCPALYKYERDNPPPSKDVFDYGTAAHRLVLGVGADIVGVDAADWRTKEAKAQRDQIRARGCTPILLSDMACIEEMALAIRSHPIASALFDPEGGQPEASLFWQDEDSGVMCRGRVDWLPYASGNRLIIADYKTARHAEPQAFARDAASYRYHMQAAWYIDGVKALGLDDDPAFVFVVQEKTAPYLVTVVELDISALYAGRTLNRKALDVYAECAANDTWPGYADDVALVSLPIWAEREAAA